ncbi:MAG: divergent PAP2 family protein [Nanoarchaeota archaeon]|nr:divergent PAP2 family protein [Nanoarchaeota archaeon]
MHEKFLLIFQNELFMSIVYTFLITSSLKVIINLIKTKTFDATLFFKSGHMPSSHTAVVLTLISSVFYEEGLTTLFVITMVFGLIVIYDAMGVRQAAGKQAGVLNKIIKEFNMTKRLKAEHLYEFVGHTPKEVIVGAFLGFLISFLVYNVF